MAPDGARLSFGIGVMPSCAVRESGRLADGSPAFRRSARARRACETSVSRASAALTRGTAAFAASASYLFNNVPYGVYYARSFLDLNGNLLADGDSVTLIKDLKVKGSGGVTLKRGTLVKNIRLTGDPDEIEANVEKVRGLVLRTEFVKRA